MAKIQISKLAVIGLCTAILIPNVSVAKPTPHGTAIRANGVATSQSGVFSVDEVNRLNELWKAMIQQPRLKFEIGQLKVSPSTTESLFFELAKSGQQIPITKNFSITGLPPKSIDHESQKTSESCIQLVGNIQTLIETYCIYIRSRSRVEMSEQYLRDLDKEDPHDDLRYTKRNAQIELNSSIRENTKVRNNLINLTNPKAVDLLDLSLREIADSK